MSRRFPNRPGGVRLALFAAADAGDGEQPLDDEEPAARGMVRRGYYAGMFDAPGWAARIAGLHPRARSEALLAGCRIIEDELIGSDPAAARSMAFAIGALVDADVQELPGPTAFLVVDLRASGRGPQRMGCADLKELVERLRSLAECEGWLLP